MNTPRNYLIDMDGVLVRGRTAIPGAQDFIGRLRDRDAKYLVLTNNPMYTPADLAHRLQNSGLDIPADRIFTSAMATAQFLHWQRPRGTAFVIGESGVTSALHEAGYIITDHAPDYVVLGETTSLNFEAITKAIRLVAGGARFIATNPDSSGPTEDGIVPACGAMAALIERATGRSPLFIGKPAPLMMRSAMNHLGVHSQNTVMVGDRMDTDIIAGLQAGMDTILVLSGVTARDAIDRFPYRPTWVLGSVAEIEV
ncbi:MAG TPA: HAD-IIA family hydrolase [Candidatus Hydrogenedentes bacterium]|nr:HAD-IIA family hydrolase [Candidatus Hydrogenedentota bacterium]HOC72118.1 HAD-IIA family hydrolase [Candidatus Hydrogenedentota bacterium]HOH50179.1 HAD-IIA family hydrolase [Candidatus Hydrogenedentota bacterium]HPA41863.1 HAD-IIA family hydrolase [Candidatus Hydrogenedentota bacterium]HQL94458.1 HAD-IIA family hydrolase [Candidatus Hydrogenedentota bacterium]